MFSLGEVTNLLASTDHRQRLYALDMLNNALDKDPSLILEKLLDPQVSGVSVRLLQFVQGGKLDTFRIYTDFFNSIMGFLFSDLQKHRHSSFLHACSEQPGLSLY